MYEPVCRLVWLFKISKISTSDILSRNASKILLALYHWCWVNLTFGDELKFWVCRCRRDGQFPCTEFRRQHQMTCDRFLRNEYLFEQRISFIRYYQAIILIIQPRGIFSIHVSQHKIMNIYICLIQLMSKGKHMKPPFHITIARIQCDTPFG